MAERRIPRRDRKGMSPLKAGALAVGILALVVFFGFTKDIPFTQGFQVKAVFDNAIVRPNSPVRIAGVNVGKVTGIERMGDTDLSVVTMEISDDGLPLRQDARARIRPRIFLEGNFFVDLEPGAPSGPELEDGDTIRVTNTSTAVQLDEVLTALQSDSRAGLQDLLDGLGTGLSGEPTAAEDAEVDPDVRGLTGAEALNRSLEDSPEALEGATAVNRATLGTEPGDLSRLVAGLAKVSRALGSRERQLQDLVDNFNTTVSATAGESTNLRRAIRLLGPTLDTTNGALGSLNAAFPPTRAFAREILPGVRETPATIDAAFPWIREVRGLLGPDEVQGVARQLRVSTPDVADLNDATIELLPQIDAVDRCLLENILPAGETPIRDEFTTGKEPYKEFWYALVGLSSEGQNVDGNGAFVRFQPGGGSRSISTARSQKTDERYYGSPAATPLGTRPRYPGYHPPYRPDVECHTQKPADINGPAAALGPADGTQPGSVVIPPAEPAP